MLIRTILAALTMATSAPADTALTVDEFEAIVTGRSFEWGRQGRAPYGIETYGTDRRVLWTIPGRNCEPGYYAAGSDNRICFFYPDSDTSQCFVMTRQGDNLRATTDSGTPANLTPSSRTATCIDSFLGA